MDQKNTLTSEAVCPFLGLRVDRDTRFGFANEGNHCHRERNPRSINLDYQSGVCLTSGYLNCPIYMHSGAPVASGAANTIPKEVILKGRTNDSEGSRSRAAGARASATPWPMLEELESPLYPRRAGSLFAYTWFRLLFGLLLVGGSISGMLLLLQSTDSGNPGNGSGFATATPLGGVIPIQATETPTLTLPPSPTETFSPTGTPSLTATTSPSPTASPTASPTGSLTPTPTNTVQFIFWTNTPIPTSTPTNTKTPTPTLTLFPPTSTPVPPTNTPQPPTITPTNTPISDIPTDTPTP